MPRRSQHSQSPCSLAKMPWPGRLLGATMLTVALSAAITTPLGAAPIQVPPIVTPASAEHHPGKPIFAELITPDLATAKQFYAGLFGWTFHDIAGGSSPYAEAYLDGNAVAGLVEKSVPAGEHRQPAWLNFFAVTDVDAAAKIVAHNGGKVLVAPHDLANRGREAVLADPQGAVFALLASSSGDPPDVLVAPGDWIWRSLITSDPVADAGFYNMVFGYEVYPLPATPGEQHLLLATENFARASANSLPSGRPNVHPHWLAFVRVADATKAAAKVTALGGQVLVEPRVDRHGGMIAVVADPLGAPFGLMEWSDTQTNQVVK
jgi:predicted enzyme related to lactoylglutathione lyase